MEVRTEPFRVQDAGGQHQQGDQREQHGQERQRLVDTFEDVAVVQHTAVIIDVLRQENLRRSKTHSKKNLTQK